MKILLKKVRKKTPFSWINPIKVEPLELAYLQAVIEGLYLDCVLCDDLFYKEDVKAEIIVLNGYNTARDQMMSEAKVIKERSPGSIVIASGVDVQVNWKLYLESDFDYLVVSNQLCIFKNLIEHLVFNKTISLNGILVLKDHQSSVKIQRLSSFEDIIPNRTYFDKIKHQTRYLLYENVALVKRSHGCLFKCEFCYCKQLNKGHFVSRDFKSLYAEMITIKADYFWVVDDVFMSHISEAEAFVKTFKNKGFKMIIYLRADFIAKHSEIIKALKSSGIVEVIVGLESIKATTLKGFNKGYTPNVNTLAIHVLKEANLSFTALFMVHISDELKDFKALKQYIKTHEIKNYTFSIFTPLRGTDIYKKYEKDIIDFKCEHYDFLHLVLKPLKMSSFMFKLAFMQLFVFQLFHSKPARQLINKLFKDSMRRGV